ncbi:MAG TPA: hypothetical protein VNL91_07350, partial [Thermoanaerobaculia bacterium]|nr:hypothetical protein [Thermoanaerobaculia bacterium]
MKAVMLLVLAGACAMTPTTGPLPIRVLQSGSYAAGPGSAPAIEVATDEERYRVLWQSVMAGKVPPPVDFTKESVVLLFLGERPTGGYAL